jgi:cell division protease FtsH
MVTEFGMSELGPLALGHTESQPFLGRDLGHTQDYSDVVAAKIDAEVRRLVEEAHDEAREILMKYRKKLDLMVVRLLEKESLEKEEVAEILAEVAKQSPANTFDRRRRTAKTTTRSGKSAPKSRPRRAPKPRLGEA